MPEYDLIVIGGGATGAGIALDAALRGVSVLLVEQNDFGEGTSSRSTKLVHGGVRYLEAAVKHLDKEQWDLVREGLRERKIFLHNAPHLAHPVELITPLYRWREIPYVYAGLLLYDLLSGRASLGRSRLLGPQQARRINPDIDPEGLKGAVSYYDGAFNDSRMVIALLQSAQERGALLLNHTEVIGLIKQEGRIRGVRTRSRIDGEEAEHTARVVLNAAGPFADRIRRMEDPDLEPLIECSSGVHIILPARFLPSPDGVLIPRTRDGRVLFALPFEGHCLAGTTDRPAEAKEHPVPTREEIDYLIEHLNAYFDMKVRCDDILSSFSGLRPLVREAGAGSTAEVVREFVTELSPGGLLTVTGGKWTAYRAMAEKAVDQVCNALEYQASCTTSDYPVVGSRLPRREIAARLKKLGASPERIDYLYRHYGDRSPRILETEHLHQASARLHSDHPATEGELLYTLRHEYVRKPLDFLIRRCNLAMIDRSAALAALPRVVEIMGRELGWDADTAAKQSAEARERLEEGI